MCHFITAQIFLAKMELIVFQVTEFFVFKIIDLNVILQTGIYVQKLTKSTYKM
jgi:hypothetical protein